MNEPDRVSLAFIWDVNSPRFNRRAFMKTMAFLSAAGFAAAACGSDNSGSGSGGGGDNGGSEAKSLNFYNWTDYIAKTTLPNFQEQTGIKVTYDNYASNDELFATVSGGGANYDIIVPTDATLVKLKHGDLLEKLDLSLITNVKNLDPRFREAAYDPGNEYSIPWQWGTTGIGYDPTKVGSEVKDWDAMMLASIKNKCSYLDEARDAFAMALFALGKDPNTTNEDDLDDAEQYLIDLKKTIKAITSDYQDPLRSGELILAQAYSGDIFQIQVDKPNIDYIIPTSGAFSWVDSMTVPKGAPHKVNAEKFMNYILEPEVGAALTNYVSYGSPNKAATPLI